MSGIKSKDKRYTQRKKKNDTYRRRETHKRWTWRKKVQILELSDRVFIIKVQKDLMEKNKNKGFHGKGGPCTKSWEISAGDKITK